MAYTKVEIQRKDSESKNQKKNEAKDGEDKHKIPKIIKDYHPG